MYNGELQLLQGWPDEGKEKGVLSASIQGETVGAWQWKGTMGST